MPKKLLLAILSAILMPVVASAQSFLVDYFPVLVYGDTDIYKQVFNGVAVMFNNKTTVGFVTNVVGILAFIMIVWRLTFRHGSAGGGETGSAPWEMFFKQFAFLCIIMFVFLNPAFKSTVTIIDQRTFFGKQTIGGGASKIPIDNVPTVLAFVASGTSYLGYALVNLVDTAFASSKINGARYSDIGFMTNFSSLDRNKMLELPGPKNQAPNEERAIKKLIRFIEKCALPYEEITGDRLQAMEFGSSSYTGLDPNTWRYKDRIKHLEAERGVSCLDYYNNIDGQVTDAFKTWEKRAILSMGLNPGTAGPALKAMGESTLAAPDNVAGKKTNMSGLLQYHLRSSMDKAVAAARYNDSLGVTGASAEAINQSIFLFSAQTLPKALHILIAILYAIFPFMLVVVAIRGYPEGLKILYYFAGGMLSMELIKMSMALIHGIVSHITATNGAEILGAATGGNGQTVDYNNIVHGEAYFRYMAEQATLAADIGTAAMFMIPMVIATGQVKLLGSALGGAVTGHAPNATMQSANAEMAKANDAENRGADTVVAGYAAAAVMKGIEENNAAIASLSKMEYYNDFNKGQIGQQLQQIGSTIGYGSELKSAQDFAAVRSGGMFQGVQSAANMKSLGQEFESEQNFLNGKHSDGRALARTLGNDATAKTIGSARGLMAGDFFNEHGDFDMAREGNIYRQGLENQARISANQTAGVGKLGEFTRAEMNAIQYGAEAGALGQIAQGNSLRRVFGTGAGFQESYSAMANTQADMQNYTARETTRSAREHFGNSLRGGGSSGISFADAARGNADLKHDQFAGTAEGYNEVDHKDRPFQKLAAAQTQATGDSANNTIKSIQNKIEQEMKDNLNENFETEHIPIRESMLSSARSFASANTQKERQEILNRSTGTMAGDIKASKEADQVLEKETNRILGVLTDNLNQVREQDTDTRYNELGLTDKDKNAMAQSEFVRGLTDNMTQSNVGAVTGSDAMRSSGMMTGGGIVTNAGMNAMTMNSLQQNHSMMALNDRFSDNNSASLAKSMQDMGMNAAQISSIMSAKGADRANRFLAATRSSNLQGTFQGRSFNLAAGVDGQFHGSFDSRVSITGGVTADMGEAYSYLAYSAGGVKGARNWGTTKTVYNGVMDTIGTVGEVASLVRGGGKLGGIRKAFKGSPSQTGNAGGIVENGVMPRR